MCRLLAFLQISHPLAGRKLVVQMGWVEFEVDEVFVGEYKLWAKIVGRRNVGHYVNFSTRIPQLT